MGEDKRKHLDFIQLTITRMGANSFLIKGWTVTLVAALFVLSSDNSNLNYITLALVPTFLFWGLDGYYLWQERRFRTLYDVVRSKEPEQIDYAMYCDEMAEQDLGWLAATFSKTLLMFHGVLTISILLIAILGDLDWREAVSLVSTTNPTIGE